MTRWQRWLELLHLVLKGISHSLAREELRRSLTDATYLAVTGMNNTA